MDTFLGSKVARGPPTQKRGWLTATSPSYCRDSHSKTRIKRWVSPESAKETKLGVKPLLFSANDIVAKNKCGPRLIQQIWGAMSRWRLYGTDQLTPAWWYWSPPINSKAAKFYDSEIQSLFCSEIFPKECLLYVPMKGEEKNAILWNIYNISRRGVLYNASSTGDEANVIVQNSRIFKCKIKKWNIFVRKYEWKVWKIQNIVCSCEITPWAQSPRFFFTY